MTTLTYTFVVTHYGLGQHNAYLLTTLWYGMEGYKNLQWYQLVSRSLSARVPPLSATPL